MVARWLLKEEPSHYSYADLERDGRTEWSGVHNALALRHLKSMKVGDEGIYYHSGDERACVGLLRIATAPRPDLKDDRGSYLVEVRPWRPLARPVALAEIRADPTFAGFDLLRISRLSVLPVPGPMWTRLLRLAATPLSTAGSEGRARATARRRRGSPARRTR
jgi:predicted RNA-binding protein with PUA-like domain